MTLQWQPPKPDHVPAELIVDFDFFDVPASVSDPVVATDGVVIAVEHGDADYAFTQVVAAEAMRAAAAAGTWWLIFDFADARVIDYHTVAVGHGDSAMETGLARYRIALVGRPADPMLVFFETVGLNRGVATKSFATRDEAKRWLRG